MKNAALNVNSLMKMKQDGEKIAMLTCYDSTFAAAMDQAGVDIILVGDSLGMVVQGRSSTVGVEVEDIAYHTACVSKGLNRIFLLADMPFGSYHDPATAFENAVTLLSAGGAMVSGTNACFAASGCFGTGLTRRCATGKSDLRWTVL